MKQEGNKTTPPQTQTSSQTRQEDKQGLGEKAGSPIPGVTAPREHDVQKKRRRAAVWKEGKKSQSQTERDEV